jgi:hypothetical protein
MGRIVNILFMKTLAMDVVNQTYHSPQRKDFTWQEGIMVAQCADCASTGTIGLGCTCGIYGSPNIEALDEYAKHPTSFNVLLQAYGRVDVWTAPDDIWQAYIVRCWAAKVIGIVEDKNYPLFDNNIRSQAAVAATYCFDVKAYPLKFAKDMIRETWLIKDNKVCIDPYDAKENDLWRKLDWDWKK